MILPVGTNMELRSMSASQMGCRCRSVCPSVQWRKAHIFGGPWKISLMKANGRTTANAERAFGSSGQFAKCDEERWVWRGKIRLTATRRVTPGFPSSLPSNAIKSGSQAPIKVPLINSFSGKVQKLHFRW